MLTITLLAVVLIALAGIAAGAWHVARGGVFSTLIGLNAMQSGFEVLGQVVGAILEAAAEAGR